MPLDSEPLMAKLLDSSPARTKPPTTTVLTSHLTGYETQVTKRKNQHVEIPVRTKKEALLMVNAETMAGEKLKRNSPPTAPAPNGCCHKRRRAPVEKTIIRPSRKKKPACLFVNYFGHACQSYTTAGNNNNPQQQLLLRYPLAPLAKPLALWSPLPTTAR